MVESPENGLEARGNVFARLHMAFAVLGEAQRFAFELHPMPIDCLEVVRIGARETRSCAKQPCFDYAYTGSLKNPSTVIFSNASKNTGEGTPFRS